MKRYSTVLLVFVLWMFALATSAFALMPSAFNNKPTLQITKTEKKQELTQDENFKNLLQSDGEKSADVTTSKTNIAEVLKYWAERVENYWTNTTVIFRYRWNIKWNDLSSWFCSARDREKKVEINLLSFVERNYSNNINANLAKIEEIKNFIDGDPEEECIKKEKILGLRGNQIKADSQSPEWLIETRSEWADKKTHEILDVLLEKKWSTLFGKLWKQLEPVLKEYREIEIEAIEKVQISGEWTKKWSEIKNLIKLDQKTQNTEKELNTILKKIKTRDLEENSIQEEMKKLITRDLQKKINWNDFFTKLETSVNNFAEKIQEISNLITELSKVHDFAKNYLVIEMIGKEYFDAVENKDKSRILFNKQITYERLWDIFYEVIKETEKENKLKPLEKKQLLQLKTSSLMFWNIWKDFQNFWIDKVEIKGKIYSVKAILENKSEIGERVIENELRREFKERLSTEIIPNDNFFAKGGKVLTQNVLVKYKLPLKQIMINDEIYFIENIINEQEQEILGTKAEREWKKIIKQNIQNEAEFEQILEEAKIKLLNQFWNKTKKWLVVLKENNINIDSLEQKEWIEDYKILIDASATNFEEISEIEKNKLTTLLEKQYKKDHLLGGLFDFLDQVLLKQKQKIFEHFNKLKSSGVTDFWFERINLETKHLQKINNKNNLISFKVLTEETKKELLALIKGGVSAKDFEKIVSFDEIEKIYAELTKEKNRIKSAGLTALNSEENNVFSSDWIKEKRVRDLTSHQRKSLRKLIGKNIKQIVDQSIDASLNAYWKILKNKMPILQKYKIKSVVLKNNDKEKEINLMILANESAEKVSEFTKREHLEELKKVKVVSNENFEIILSRTIKQKANTKLTKSEKPNSKEAKIGIVAAGTSGGLLVGSGLIWYFLKRRNVD